jgi:hypothetical protein
MPASGTIYPSYYVASVTYSPPGMSSSVEYESGSRVGSTTSTTWAHENTVSAEYKTGLSVPLIGGDTLKFTFERVWSNTGTHETDVLETIDATTRVNCDPTAGACGDFIDHDSDQILLLFNTKINVLSYTNTNLPAGMPRVRWGLDFSQVTPQIVKVGWLTGSVPMPTNVQNTLQMHGVTSQDYDHILNSDPFAFDSSGSTRPDPDRFQYITVLPYEPTVPNSYTWSTENNYTSSDTNGESVSYTAGASWTGQVLSNELEVSGKHTWTSSSSSTNSQSGSNTQTVVLTMPSATYTGPTNMYVYVDKIYKTFMFSFLAPQ